LKEEKERIEGGEVDRIEIGRRRRRRRRRKD